MKRWVVGRGGGSGRGDRGSTNDKIPTWFLMTLRNKRSQRREKKNLNIALKKFMHLGTGGVAQVVQRLPLKHKNTGNEEMYRLGWECSITKKSRNIQQKT
jgi:hypothetical protein